MLTVLLAGCDRDEIRVYNAPKDELPRQAAAPSQPQLTWKLPEGWKETAPNSAVSVAAFTVPGPKGENAEVSIARLTNLSGKEATLVNMWRANAGLTPLSPEESLKQLSPVEVGGEKGSMFEVTGNTTDGHAVAIVTAMVNHPDGSWFYKLAGEPSVVEAQKPVFIEFLKSVKIQQESATPMAGAPTEETSAEKFNWTVPPGWKPSPHNEMQIALFSVPGKADVSVSVFPGDTGGTLANVNRWRRKLALPPATEENLPSLISPLDPADSQAILVNMTNNNQQLIGAIVPRDGKYWFYKLQGDAVAVAPQKDAFIAFAKSKP